MGIQAGSSASSTKVSLQYEAELGQGLYEYKCENKLLYSFQHGHKDIMFQSLL